MKTIIVLIMVAIFFCLSSVLCAEGIQDSAVIVPYAIKLVKDQDKSLMIEIYIDPERAAISFFIDSQYLDETLKIFKYIGRKKATLAEIVYCYSTDACFIP